MPSLKAVKERINSVISTQQITKAMKMVAAAKLRKAQDRVVQMRPYADKLRTILVDVSSALNNDEQSIYAQSREESKVLIVMVTSDRGLCGPFNSNVIKKGLSLLASQYTKQYAAGDVTFMCIGVRGAEFLKKRGYQVIENYSNLFQNISFENTRRAAEWVMNNFAAGKYDKVELIYNKFKNIATQIASREQYLPVQENIEKDKQASTIREYIFEPSKQEIVLDLIPKSLKIIFYKALLESNASEHAARMTAMDKATENANELLKELKLTYNRTRQAAITKEILEIVGGAEALSQFK